MPGDASANAPMREARFASKFHVKQSDPDRQRALALVPLSKDVEARLAIYVDLLARWRTITNLISATSFSEVWTRHIADSAQLLPLVPEARRWVDLGSGAGFPGLVIAIVLADVEGARVHCIESDRRKCAFLREVVRATGAPAEIHAERVEDVAPEALLPVDAATARAFAPLPRLIELAKVWIVHGAVGIFPRGRTAESQLEALPDAPDLSIDVLASRLDPESAIVRVRSISKAS
ncbi:MAG: 16S rRNA (guanine(527)-N(7))-methyltransferase RsmG [Bradyrhizobium sp.]|nr:MAG: 16S rRNA (guanine(527)-N(7))-methyltransferase RsmG [Bradyrhizobium sp.]